MTSNYQSHETLPVTICEATGMPLDPDDDWSLDIDRVAAAIKHDPTGTIQPRERYDALIELCRKHGTYILHDEIFNGLEKQARGICPSLQTFMSAVCR